MCVTRLQSLHSKLKKEENLLREYDNIIQEQRKKGIIEIVPTPKEETLGGTQLDCKIATKGIHYSPHHAVIRKERETTKVRIVYDGSAKNSKDKRSLNDCLEMGENYIPHIFAMLTNFRWNFVALTADIEKAFLMVGPSPSILGETIAYHLNLYRQTEPEMFELLRKSLYVDDLLKGQENDEKGLIVYQKSKKMMASEGFTSENGTRILETC
ncbi:uncharacterized protein [Montipora foliosa]|uniref:uncharacterized protein n=1 Tax=Montipora foliosa TaxID=591990 RepID=UPI0035F1D018